MRKLLLFAGILAAMALPLGGGAAVYKSVDEDGNVTFSDTPSPGAEEIEIKEVPTVPSRVPNTDFSSDDGNEGRNAEPGSRYDNIAIVSPENDTAIRNNAGSLSVSVSIQPALAQSHQVVLFMDGTEAARSRSPVFQFSNVDRGTHTLTAAIVDGDGNELIRSDSVSFTLHRHSVQQPNANVPGTPGAPSPSGPSPTNPPTGGNAPAPSGPTPTNPPSP